MFFSILQRQLILRSIESQKKFLKLLHPIKTLTTSMSSTASQNKANGSSELSPADRGKRAAAIAAVEKHVQSGQKLGVGTGSTVKFVIDSLIEKAKAGKLRDLVCVPTSFETRNQLIGGGLQVVELDQCPRLDVCIDGADECLKHSLHCIKGGGGALLREKVVASCAREFIIVGHSAKLSDKFGQAFSFVPLEVLPEAWKPIQLRIEKQFGGQAALRMAAKKIGPLVTDNGNFILDWHFDRSMADGDWLEMDQSLHCIPGLLETGLFLNMAGMAYFGDAEANVQALTKSAKCELGNV